MFFQLLFGVLEKRQTQERIVLKHDTALVGEGLVTLSLPFIKILRHRKSAILSIIFPGDRFNLILFITVTLRSNSQLLTLLALRIYELPKVVVLFRFDKLREKGVWFGLQNVHIGLAFS